MALCTQISCFSPFTPLPKWEHCLCLQAAEKSLLAQAELCLWPTLAVVELEGRPVRRGKILQGEVRICEERTVRDGEEEEEGEEEKETIVKMSFPNKCFSG